MNKYTARDDINGQKSEKRHLNMIQWTLHIIK